MIAAFILWEAYGAPHPMFPRRLRQDPRILSLTLVITFISGANFFSILMFWPTQAFNVYGHDPVGVGIRGLPVSFGILGGAVVVLWLLSVFRGHNKERKSRKGAGHLRNISENSLTWYTRRLVMMASSVLMTAGCGSLAVATADNLHVLWGLLVLAGIGIGGK